MDKNIEITVIKETNEIQVRTVKTNNYVLYGYGQKEKFLAEVENSTEYVDKIDWTVKPVIAEWFPL